MSLGSDEISIRFLQNGKINKCVFSSISNINEFMRPHFLSKNKADVYRSQDEYFPTFIKGQKAAVPFNYSNKLKHIRSSSNLLEEGIVNSLNIQPNNQQLFLPKIRELSIKQQNIAASKSIDQLQVYVHHLLLKNLKQHKENKQIKSFEMQIDKKKVDLTKKEEQNKKEKEVTRLQHLRLKLTQLYGEMTLEQNKLKIEYSVQEKMEKKFTNLYEHIAKRFKRNDLVDTAQNTQISTNNQGRNCEKTVNSKKILSRFRVVGFAVLFAVFFPKYSSSFKSQRRKHFQKIINHQKSLQKQLNNCHKLFEEIKLKSFWKKIQNKSGQSLLSITSQNKSLSSNNSSEQQLNPPNENKIIQILKFILQNIFQAIKLGKIDQLIKVSSLSLSNRSYLTDQLFLSKQLKNMTVDKINKLINLDKFQQKVLIGNLYITKLTAFSFMMNNSIVSKNSQQYIFQNKQNGKYENLNFTIAKYLQIAGLYLIDLCNQAAQLQKQQAQTYNHGNLKELQQQSLPLPMPELKFESKKIIRSKKTLHQRTSIQQIMRNGDINQEGISVSNCEYIRKIIKKVPQQIQNTLLQLIESIKEEVYAKFAEFKRGYYRQFSEMAFIKLRNEQINLQQTKEIRSPQQLQVLHQLHLYLNKDISPNKNIIFQSQRQDEISQKSNDSQQKRVKNRSTNSLSNEAKETQSRVQSR